MTWTAVEEGLPGYEENGFFIFRVWEKNYFVYGYIIESHPTDYLQFVSSLQPNGDGGFNETHEFIGIRFVTHWTTDLPELEK